MKWVPVAEVARPHGVGGELRLRLFNPESDLLLQLDELLIRLSDGSEHEVSVDGARRANDAILMKLFSVDDRDGAAHLRGAVLCARREDFPPLAPGEFYACDVEGARVIVGDGDVGGCELGRVRTLRSYPGAQVLVVDSAEDDGSWEVPLVDSVVRSIDLEANLVTLATMEGVERA
jgi:16S rRNA processing protein RimM